MVPQGLAVVRVGGEQPLVVGSGNTLERFEGIPRPVHCRRVAQERPAAAVEVAPNDPVFRVVVGGPGILVQVEARITSHAPAEGLVTGIGKSLQVEDAKDLADVIPVEHHREFLVVHPLARQGNLHRSGFRVLPKMSFPGLLVHVEHIVGGPEGMKDRPVGHVFDGVVRTVGGAPTLDAEQIAPVIEVFPEELPAGSGIGADQLPLLQGPRGRRHGRFDVNRNRVWGRAADPRQEPGEEFRQVSNPMPKHRQQMVSNERPTHRNPDPTSFLTRIGKSGRANRPFRR